MGRVHARNLTLVVADRGPRLRASTLLVGARSGRWWTDSGLIAGAWPGATITVSYHRGSVIDMMPRIRDARLLDLPRRRRITEARVGGDCEWPPLPP